MPQAVIDWPQVLSHLVARQDLTPAEASWAMDQIMSGRTSPVHLASFLVALSAKGPSAEEIGALAAVMLDHAIKLEVGTHEAVDLVGTGGDGAHSVNVSTMAALVVAATGTPVVKHGNRASTSKCGSADVLAELGVDLSDSPEVVASIFTDVGLGFCFANVFHPAMRHVAQVRRELGVPTVFNVLGPLVNPAQPRANFIGCARQPLAPIMADVFARRGQDAIVFRARNGLDELTTAAVNDLWVATGGQVTHLELDAVAELGLAPSTVADLRGGDPQFNAQVVRDLLAGQQGPVRDTVLLNAAGALTTYELAEHGPAALRERLQVNLVRVAAAVDSGAAAAVLAQWVRASQERA
ncbi:anthranilate phosphoribosyltransferase [Buchananella hordeovulneris]|uniref:Anthranilate phosphoribosyltransferase n=1 Tax=Buchananella hordeovulneris TaxID=52770 RepID=A0A1Q5PU29_9ACTO|nr:anthranilate phosphoribosyltransferase [Buchananella hordeovulneris]OKL50965.1 anthranilate phosphoribosyltransferase [Buchananella hordeovulneris]RRD44172.1 anthranilate phosphoribosyltransferase [Buchananella hordeovulneris]RRD53938.1 anthranilate phosphoribosyltransferase [Buchananella hordeovulneris]